MTSHSPPAGAAGEPFQFAVVCPVEKPVLAILRRFVAAVAAESGFSEDDVMKIELSVDEACSNIVRHAYPAEAGGDKRLELKLRLDPDGLTVFVRDDGRGGPPAQFRGAADIEAYRRDGRPRYDGLGLLIMRQFMDEVGIDTAPGRGAAITMRKRRNPAA